METDLKTPKAEVLRRKSYSELKKLAKEHGIKGNLKATKIISALCNLSSDDIESFLTPVEQEINSSKKATKIISALCSDDIESFSTPVQQEINSSKKKKEEKFDQDVATPLATPRRGTYSLGSPTDIEEKFDAVTPLPAPRIEISVESPKSVKAEDTTFASIPFDTSILDMSNVTIGRGSERKLRRKVSFMTPERKSSTPKNASIKLRPKTPIATRASLGKRVSFSTPPKQQKRRSIEKSFRTTPHPKTSLGGKQFALNDDDDGIIATTPLPSTAELSEGQEVTPSVEQTENMSSEIVSNDAPKENVKTPLPSTAELTEKQKDTASVKRELRSSTRVSAAKVQSATKATRFTTPGSTKPLVAKDQGATKNAKLATPGSAKPFVAKAQGATKSAQLATPGSAKLFVAKAQGATKSAQLTTPGSAKPLVAKAQGATKSAQLATPGLGISKEASTKIKRGVTPNFKKIHEKEFQKMESIDDYQTRKIENSAKKIKNRPDLRSRVTKAKTRLPAPSFCGIPFIPSVSSFGSERLKMDLKTKNVTTPVVDMKVVKKINENAQKSNKSKFDLKASLSRKLGYKPYRGPVKPLAESNTVNTPNTPCVHKPKAAVKKVITNRLQNRSALKGVRTNKRFELQMKNRKLN